MIKFAILLVCLAALASLSLGQTPTTEKGWFDLGFKQRSEYKFAESVTSFNECLRLNPKSSPCTALRGMSYWNLSKYDLASKDLDNAIVLSPTSAQLYVNRGEFRLSWLDAAKTDLAITDFSKAISLKPGHVQAYMGRAQSYAFKNDLNAAIADYNKVLELDPKNSSAQTALQKLKAKMPTAQPTPTPLNGPPVYITADVVTSISQVKDVTSKDEYFLHLKALIESHKVKNLTNQYKYNGAAKLDSADLSYLASNGQIAMMAIAKDRGITESKYKAQFGRVCSTPVGKNGVLSELEVVDHLKCLFALTEMKNNTPTNIVTKGRFAMLLNQALNLWIRKIDAL